jgi:hypothetical protein
MVNIKNIYQGNRMKKLLIGLTIGSVLLTSCNSEKQVDVSPAPEAKTEVSVAKNELKDVYWGDTHLHTELSMDAGGFGNRVDLDGAYRFARGEKITASSGQMAKLSRPLDFLVVADHSDGMGLIQAVLAKEKWVMATPEGKRWSKLLDEGKNGEMALDLIKNFSQNTISFGINDKKLANPVWHKIVDAAEKYNEPGKFTAFIGYEWTSLIKGNNLHRCVIYRDDAEKTRDFLPYTAEQSVDPEDLWKYMAKYEANSGGKVLAIPHNGNLSNGMMFAETRINGEPFTEAYIKERIRREPLYEITQIKGDGEAHPFLSPNDEFADYENWDKGNLDLSSTKKDEMLQYEYGRSALKLGLKIKQQLGTDPYKMGFIGSTDAHTSLATADENNFFGKASNVEPSKERGNHVFVGSEHAEYKTYETVASGYAAVWASSNTREDLFDGMASKETYATTGSRIKLRFFGGWDFSQKDLDENYVKTGYDRGVSMGSDLIKATSKAPTFLLNALMDPESGALDRIQIVKGWVNKDGSLDEKVFDVVWSGDRKIGKNGKLPKVSNTVNLDDATWSNDEGSAELKTVWTDPEFDASKESFYYARVIEIPTPRWTLFDKVRFGAEFDGNVKLTSTERAYSSPIWYSAK